MPGINTLQRVAVAASIAALSACAMLPGTSPTTTTSTPYPSGPTTQAYVQYARVTNVELISTEQQPPSSGIGAGAVIGGVVGGLLGRQVGGGTGQDIATVAGVVGGALVGNAIQRNQVPPTVTQLYRVTVQQDNGGIRSFDYAEQPNVRVGDRVRIENDQLYR
ncbi:glycine zipper 2TM domain-containing protein [Zeimonas arvi]|uniref:Glycine zipper 2TM domain-containing protein n=1 Tax=Zeimonas arvi TaxID=2498847 RepID=A0A5C8NW75_9BURK|nr:glycine zipper 2TM domain-containing protein [Zeimonas arvi]TXL65230.1 glycine zipper 2TM domain-containing protein [Zeimonas arvi]